MHSAVARVVLLLTSDVEPVFVGVAVMMGVAKEDTQTKDIVVVVVVVVAVAVGVAVEEGVHGERQTGYWVEYGYGVSIAGL